MKVGEQFIFDDAEGKIIHKKSFSNDPYLDMAKQYRDAGVGMTGEHRLAGIVPMHILNEWLKEAGVTWDDREAAQEVVKRKMLSGEFDKLRVWEGTY